MPVRERVAMGRSREVQATFLWRIGLVDEKVWNYGHAEVKGYPSDDIILNDVDYLFVVRSASPEAPPSARRFPAWAASNSLRYILVTLLDSLDLLSLHTLDLARVDQSLGVEIADRFDHIGGVSHIASRLHPCLYTYYRRLQ